MKYPWLDKLENWLQTGEQVINIVAPRALIVAVCISLVDLLTSGSLLNLFPFVVAWAIIQAMAVEATLPEIWRRSANYFSEKKWLPGGSLAFIGVLLSVVVFYALLLQFLQQAEHIGLIAAMAWLNINPATIAIVRAVSVAFLIPVFAILNRTKSEQGANETPKNIREEKKLSSGEVEVAMKPWVIEKNLSEETELYSVPKAREITTELHLVGANTREERKNKIRSLLAENPTLRTGELAKLSGIPAPRISELKREIEAEQKEEVS